MKNKKWRVSDTARNEERRSIERFKNIKIASPAWLTMKAPELRVSKGTRAVLALPYKDEFKV